jgi:periplasmic divalent cation tolerance protein
MSLKMKHIISVVYTTISSREEAEELANKAVSADIAACVNIIPNVTSIYKWEGSIEKSDEFVMLFKTQVSNKEKLQNWIIKNHPYDVPAILSSNPDTSPDFCSFILENTAN